MTWLQLIDELRKQPMWLLEQEVQINWDDNHTERAMEDVAYVDTDHNETDVSKLSFVQLVSPTNEGEDPSMWTEDSGCSLSMTVMPTPKSKPKEKFLVYATTILDQSFFIEAEDKNDAFAKAHQLVNNRRFFDDYMHANWSYNNEWDTSEVISANGGCEVCDGDVLITSDVVSKYLSEE